MDATDLEEREDNPNDNYSITDLVHLQFDDPTADPIGGEIVLRRGEVESGVWLIGRPDPAMPGGIRGLDNAGWAYIRAIWVDNYKRYDTVRVAEDNKGMAEFNVLVWTYTNLLERPGLDCATNNNCIREVITLPIDITINRDTPPAGGRFYRGLYGLDCEVVQRFDTTDTSTRCEGDRFFKRIAGIDSDPVEGHENVNVISYWGRCCRPVR